MRSLFGQYMKPGIFEERIVPVLPVSELGSLQELLASYFPSVVLSKTTGNDVDTGTYLVHYVRLDAGLSESHIRELHGLSDRLDALYAEYIPPAGFLVVFRGSKEGNSARRFAEAIRDRVSSRADWREVRSAVREGPLIVDVDSAGKLASRPLGMIISEAAFEALEGIEFKA